MTQGQDNAGSIHAIDVSADSQPDEGKEHVDIDSNSCHSELLAKFGAKSHRIITSPCLDSEDIEPPTCLIFDSWKQRSIRLTMIYTKLVCN